MKAILAALLFSFAGIAVAQACSCLPPPPAPEKLAGASAVFVGRVVEVAPEGTRRKACTFAVAEVFKGTFDGNVVVSTYADSAMCGSNFQKGVAYLIYADGSMDQLSTNLCNANQPAASPQGESEITELRSIGHQG